MHTALDTSTFNNKSIFTQLFLHVFYSSIITSLDYRFDKMPPFAYPPGLQPISDFSIPQVKRVQFDLPLARQHGFDDIVIVNRTDEAGIWFVKTLAKEGASPHVIVEPDGSTIFTDLLKLHPMTTELFIMRNGMPVERFMQLANKPNISQA